MNQIFQQFPPFKVKITPKKKRETKQTHLTQPPKFSVKKKRQSHAHFILYSFLESSITGRLERDIANKTFLINLCQRVFS